MEAIEAGVGRTKLPDETEFDIPEEIGAVRLGMNDDDCDPGFAVSEPRENAPE